MAGIVSIGFDDPIGKRFMSLYFQSLCSGSGGNCLTLWTPRTRLVIDCGLSSMKRTRQTLTALAELSPIDAVLLTHIHSDHISYYPLRTLEAMELPVYLSADCTDHLKDKHFNGYGFSKLKLHTYTKRALTIGDFRIQPFELVHHPMYATFGYSISTDDKTVVIATDFYRWDNAFDFFVNADFIFVESNHDLKLLERYYNPNSRYHLPNPSTAKLLVEVCKENRIPPRTVILGHLSEQRNSARLAMRETLAAFDQAASQVPFELAVAPANCSGPLVEVR